MNELLASRRFLVQSKYMYRSQAVQWPLVCRYLAHRRDCRTVEDARGIICSENISEILKKECFTPQQNSSTNTILSTFTVLDSVANLLDNLGLWPCCLRRCCRHHVPSPNIRDLQTYERPVLLMCVCMYSMCVCVCV